MSNFYEGQKVVCINDKFPVISTTEELAMAIKNLDLCETKKDLQDLKKTTPDYIVADASFIDAGKKRYELIMATK